MQIYRPKGYPFCGVIRGTYIIFLQLYHDVFKGWLEGNCVRSFILGNSELKSESLEFTSSFIESSDFSVGGGGSGPIFSKFITTPFWTYNFSNVAMSPIRCKSYTFCTKLSMHWFNILCEVMQYERPPVTSHMASMGLPSLGTKPVSLSMAGVPARLLNIIVVRIKNLVKIPVNLSTSANSLWSHLKGSLVNSEPGIGEFIGKLKSSWTPFTTTNSIIR